MAKFEQALKGGVMFGEAIWHVAQAVAQSNHFMKPIAIFARVQVNYHVKVRMSEDRSLQSKERLWTREGEHFPGRQGRWGEKNDETDSTAASYNTDDTRRDRPTQQTEKGNEGHYQDSWNDSGRFSLSNWCNW